MLEAIRVALSVSLPVHRCNSRTSCLVVRFWNLYVVQRTKETRFTAVCLTAVIDLSSLRSLFRFTLDRVRIVLAFRCLGQ